MQVEVRVYSGLEKFVNGAKFGEAIYVDLNDAATGRTLIEKLGIPGEEIFTFMVNGLHKDLHAVLQDKDRIAMFPPVGGG